MKKIWKILRESSDPQKDTAGVPTQRKDLDTFIDTLIMFKDYGQEEKIYVQSTTYTDFEARKDFKDMLSFPQQDDVLAFADSSRFSRNVGPAVEFVVELRTAGKVRYLIIANRVFDLLNETDYTDLIKMQADEHRISRAWFKKGKDSKKEWRDKGYYTGGYDVYGYTTQKIKVGKKFRTIHVIIKEQAEIIIEIYRLYLTGLSTTDISLELNKRGIKSPENGRWGAASTLRILKQEKYLGMKDDNGIITIPQIVDENTYKEVEKLRIKNSKRGKSAKPKAIVPLRDQTECGCGLKVLYRCFRTRKGSLMHRFCCASHFPRKEHRGLNKKRCPMYIKAEELIDFVWGKIVPILQDPNKLRQVISAYVDSCFVNKLETELGIKAKQKEIDKIEARWKRTRYQDRLGDLPPEEYSEERRLYQESRLKIEEDIKSLQRKLEIDKRSIDSIMIIEKATALWRTELNNANWEQKAWWLKLLVDKVVLTCTDKGEYEVGIYCVADQLLEGYVEYLKDKSNAQHTHSQSVNLYKR